jgi:hypothetical protein
MAALIALAATGCQQFFTYSVAAPLARPPQTISSLTASTAASYAATLVNNPDPAAAKAAMDAMVNLVASTPTPAVLKDAATVAVMATGLDSALTQAITKVDVAALMAGTAATPSAATISAIADIISAASSGVTTQSTQIFNALAASASTPAKAAELAATGIGAQTFVVAAAAVAISDMTSQGLTVADVMTGTVAYTPTAGGTATTLTNLAAGASAAGTAAGDSSSQLLSTLQSFLKF